MTRAGKMLVVFLDLEGVLIPEIWVGLAEITMIEELKLTTQDISDYDELMKHRLKICDQHNLTLKDIHKVVENIEPLDGALEFLTWLRERNEVVFFLTLTANLSSLCCISCSTLLCYAIH